MPDIRSHGRTASLAGASIGSEWHRLTDRAVENVFDIRSHGRGAPLAGVSIGLNAAVLRTERSRVCFAGYSKPWPRSIPRRWRHWPERTGLRARRSKVCFAGYSKPWPRSPPRRWRHRSGRIGFMNRAVEDVFRQIFETVAAEHPPPVAASA